MTLILIIGLAFVALAVVLALQGFAAGDVRGRRTIAQIDAYGFGGRRLDEHDGVSVRKRLDALASNVGAVVNRRGNRESESKLRQQLYAAGFYTTTPKRFVGYRLFATVILAVCGFAIFAIGGGSAARVLLGTLAAAGIGWVGPTFVVKRRATARLEQIDHEMPELVDLLVTAVEAGVGFTASLQLASRSFDGPLGQELRLAIQEQSMGLTIPEALTNLLARSDTVAVRSFVQAVVQGESLGVSIGKILRDLAGEMRRRRRQAAEERAHKAGTKILFPVALLIFPAIFLVTLAPVLVELSRNLSSA